MPIGHIFNESWPHHVRFVVMCARDCRLFSTGETGSVSAFITGLNGKYRTSAAHSTGNRILLALQDTMTMRFSETFKLHRETRGRLFINSKLEIWSSGLANDS